MGGFRIKRLSSLTLAAVLLALACFVQVSAVKTAVANAPTYSSGKLVISSENAVDGFQYKIVRKKTGNKLTSGTVFSNGKTTLKVKVGLAKKKLYKASVRAFFLKGGKRVYGAWASSYMTAPTVAAYKWSEQGLKLSWNKTEYATSYALKVTDGNTGKHIRLSNISKNSYQLLNTDFNELDINRSLKITVRPYVGKKELNAGTKYTAPIEIIGHRGRMDIAPEGTLASFTEAAKAGYNSFECDYWETKSGDVLISHNNLLSKCGYPAMDIRTLTKATRKNYPIVKGANVSAYPTQYIPTAEQAIKNAATNKMKLYLHTKHSDVSDKALKKIVKWLKKYSMLDNTIVFCSNIGVVDRIVKAGLHAGYIKTPTSAAQEKTYIQTAQSHKAEVIIAQYSSLITEEIVSYAHFRGLKIGCYDINNVYTSRVFINTGADFLVTNNNFLRG